MSLTRTLALPIASAAMIMATAVPSQATLYFSTSSKSGWDTTYVQNAGTVTNGDGYFRCMQKFVANSSTRFHSEMHKSSPVVSPGQTRYFGTQFRLVSTWKCDGTNHCVWQLFRSGCCDWLGGGVNGCSYRGKTVSTGTWHATIVRITMYSGGGGIRQEWLDGAKVIDTTFAPFSEKVKWQVGLYEPTWYKKSAIPGSTQGTRSVDHRRSRIASTYAEAQ